MAKKKVNKPRKLAPGIYNAMIEKMVDNGDGTVTAYLNIKGKGFTTTERYTARPAKDCTEDDGMDVVGHSKFYVMCDRYFVYTSIGAKNVHHASNKATKLFGPHWDHITQNAGNLREYSFVKVPDFKLFLVRQI